MWNLASPNLSNISHQSIFSFFFVNLSLGSLIFVFISSLPLGCSTAAACGSRCSRSPLRKQRFQALIEIHCGRIEVPHGESSFVATNWACGGEKENSTPRRLRFPWLRREIVVAPPRLPPHIARENPTRLRSATAPAICRLCGVDSFKQGREDSILCGEAP